MRGIAGEKAGGERQKSEEDGGGAEQESDAGIAEWGK